MQIDYTIQKTDPRNGHFIVKAYTTNGPDSPIHTTPLYKGAVSANTSLVLLGRGLLDYGEPFQTNLVNLLENFAGPTPPVYPIQGQLWYNNTSTSLLVYDGANWAAVSSGSGGSSSGDVNLERIRAMSAENLLAPKSNPIFTGNITLLDGGYITKLGGTAPATWFSQDGTGRQHWYWNTSGGVSPTFTVAGEDANDLMHHVGNVSGVGGGYLIFRTASGYGKNIGDPISWTSVLFASPTSFTYMGNTVATIKDVNSAISNINTPLTNQSANLVFASPANSTGTPLFRSLVVADIPTLNQNTTGTSANITGIVTIANGGTGKTDAISALAALGGYPSSNPNSFITKLDNIATATAITGGTAGKILYQTGPGATGFIINPVNANSYLMWNGTSYTWSGITSTGSSMSVGLSLPNIFNVTNSPITSTGVINATLATQLANSVLIAPTTGGVPVFRSLIAADIPTLNQNTTGTAANVTGIIPIANGGTGQSTQQAAITTLTGTQSSGKYLRSDGTNAILSSIVAADIPTLNQNTTGTAANLAGGVANTSQLLYQSGINATKLVTAPSSSNTYLMWNGTQYTWSSVSSSGSSMSIGLSLPNIFNVTNSPLTSTGVINAALATQSANLIFASPTNSTGTPLFRSLVVADIPTLNQNTTGTSYNITGIVAITNGGTGQQTQQAAITTLTGTQSSGKYLRSDGTNATLSSIVAADIPILNQNTTGTAANVAGGSINNILYQSSTNVTKFITTPSATNTYLMWSGTQYTWNTISAVTSVGLSLPSMFSVTNSPITTAGTLTATLATQLANSVLIAPTTGGVPVFRSLIAADIPTLNQNTTGTAANVTGIVAIANGGTGQSTKQTAITALTGTQSSGKYLRSDGTNAMLSSIVAADVPILNQNTTGTAAGISSGAANTNQLLYQSGVNSTGFISTPSVPNSYLYWSGTVYSWATVKTSNSRTTTSASTPVVVPYVTTSLDFVGFKSYSLFSVYTSTAAWVRLYATSSSRTNDINRVLGVDAIQGSGLLAEVITTGIGAIQLLTPAVNGFNYDTPPSNTIYALINNLSNTSVAVAVTLTLLQLEA